VTQEAIAFPASPQEINREMLTPPNQIATDDSDYDAGKPALQNYPEEEVKGGSFSLRRQQSEVEKR